MGLRMRRITISFLICMLLIASLTPIVESVTKTKELFIIQTLNLI